MATETIQSPGDVDDVRRLYGPDAVRSEPLYCIARADGEAHGV
ncbi:hypothetical protein [Tessaracoccus lapidicaptus]